MKSEMKNRPATMDMLLNLCGVSEMILAGTETVNRVEYAEDAPFQYRLLRVLPSCLLKVELRGWVSILLATLLAVQVLFRWKQFLKRSRSSEFDWWLRTRLAWIRPE